MSNDIDESELYQRPDGTPKATGRELFESVATVRVARAPQLARCRVGGDCGCLKLNTTSLLTGMANRSPESGTKTTLARLMPEPGLWQNIRTETA